MMIIKMAAALLGRAGPMSIACQTVGVSTRTKRSRVVRSMVSSASVRAPIANVWEQITDVDIHSFPHPRYFRFLGIPNPLRAEVIDSGVGGQRIAYFDTGKRFIQRITVWKPHREYAFTFNPEQGFKVAFFFDLADGIVQISTGSYVLDEEGASTTIRLGTQYSIDRRFAYLLGLPVWVVLRGFQGYLLKAIAHNATAASLGESRPAAVAAADTSVGQ
jgi:hypothetical protein